MALTAHDDLDRRLSVLEDIERIQRIKAAYWRAIDAKNVDGALACVTEDIMIDFEGVPRCLGRAAFRAILQAGALREGAYDMHHGCNPVIRLTGAGSAAGTWSIGYRGVEAGQGLAIRMGGDYEDVYRRTVEGWRIAAMTMRQISIAMRRVGPGGAQTQAGLGATTPHNFSQQ